MKKDELVDDVKPVKLVAAYIDQKFNSQKDFNEWLGKTAVKKISLSDLGQDMQNIWIDARGEILHCDFHARLYNGKFVNLESLDEFCPIEILENGSWSRQMGLLVDEIKDV